MCDHSNFAIETIHLDRDLSCYFHGCECAASNISFDFPEHKLYLVDDVEVQRKLYNFFNNMTPDDVNPNITISRNIDTDTCTIKICTYTNDESQILKESIVDLIWAKFILKALFSNLKSTYRGPRTTSC